MAYQVQSGGILPGVLYIVTGGQSITYNAVVYVSGQTFRGLSGIGDFTGPGEVNEVQELQGGGLVSLESGSDMPVAFPDSLVLKGMAIEYELNKEEQVVYEKTRITGFALELIDYPFFSFAITETRL